MYKGQKLSLKTFQSNHSFTFIEDMETILRLTKELLDMPLCKVYHPVWTEPDFSPTIYLGEIYCEDGVLPAECSGRLDTLSYAEALALLRADCSSAMSSNSDASVTSPRAASVRFASCRPIPGCV